MEKNFYKDGQLEMLLSYELRPEIKKFRSDENIRNSFLEDFIKVFEQIGLLELSSNYKKVLQIEKAKEILGVINLNIDGLLKLNGAQKLIELEGNISWFYCSQCGMDKDSQLIVQNKDEFVCNSCQKNILKPSIPFIGQEFSQWDMKDSWMMLNSCDNLIIFADNFLSPVTISFIDIVEKRMKNIKIICSESLNYDTFDFSSNNVDFIYESNEFFLDSLVETYGDSII
ncbi:MAG: Sir2 family NAD-dependent protein deacetylase [Thermodesulfobacteriota bacteirum]|nr:Sir2 family NAD-dependent protein deacetylase [Thermodesulfobacteriota bacterium]